MTTQGRKKKKPTTTKATAPATPVRGAPSARTSPTTPATLVTQPAPAETPRLGLLSFTERSAEAAARRPAPPPPRSSSAETLEAKKETKNAIVPAENTARTVPEEQRRRMIAQAAYQRAQALGLGHTDPFQDWLIAEREVDARIASGAYKNPVTNP